MPSNTTSRVPGRISRGALPDTFFFVYVLESMKDGERYIGYSHNLKRRLEEHNKGLNFSTKFRLPFKLAYFEGCLSERDAKRREKYLKTTPGRRCLALRLKDYYQRPSTFGAGS